MAERRECMAVRQKGWAANCLLTFLPFLSAFLPFCLPALPAWAQEPAFRAGSAELVVLPVVVTDKKGRYISELTTDQFTVFDNGRRVAIEIFSNQDTPVTVGLVIDASGSMRSKIGEVAAATMAFARASNPEDELFAVQFNDDVARTIPYRPFLLAGDLGALESAGASIWPPWPPSPFDGIMGPPRPLPPRPRPPQGGLP